MACGRCGNSNRGTGAPTVVTSGKPTVHSPLRDTISGLRYVPNSGR